MADAMTWDDWVEWLSIYGMDAAHPAVSDWARMAYERWGRHMAFEDTLTTDGGVSDLEDSFIVCIIEAPAAVIWEAA